jgi:transglutaminase-like putative cysteine protease
LKNRTGDCTEFMDLFAALSRANGIPARRIGGYVCRESGVVGPDDYHNWAEFYDGAAWRIADPQRKVFMEGPSRYVAIEIIAESPKNPMGTYHRVRVSGDGLKVKMNG